MAGNPPEDRSSNRPPMLEQKPTRADDRNAERTANNEHRLSTSGVFRGNPKARSVPDRREVYAGTARQNAIIDLHLTGNSAQKRIAKEIMDRWQ